MARESFEDEQIAKFLNEHFISIKVDREERPDVDAVYMNVCQMLTGSGGWPLSVFLTPKQKPFFAGTYFPPKARYGTISFIDLLEGIQKQWKENRTNLLHSGERIVELLRNEGNGDATSDKSNREPNKDADKEKEIDGEYSLTLLQQAYQTLKSQFDYEFGGFGNAPKFPSPHILLFLMKEKQCGKGNESMDMVVRTLEQMYKGGIFDHIGYGFSRYSTDRYWLVPHFEKMLYDNALLVLAYSEAYQMTKQELFRKVVERVLLYVKREMLSEEGGFYCAQDADSEGEEGKFYTFSLDEIHKIYGEEEGDRLARYYGMDAIGNFEGKNIANLIDTPKYDEAIEQKADRLYRYRKERMELGKDDKILTSWNGLMIAAYADAYRVFQNEEYLTISKNAVQFIESHLWDGNQLYTSYRDKKRSNEGFLDDYAFMIFAYLKLYAVTYEDKHLNMANVLMKKVVADYFDRKEGGFYLTGKEGEALIHKPKEFYDGAIPSGNSVMTWNLLRLSSLLREDGEGYGSKAETLERIFIKQNAFMARKSVSYPSGCCFYLYALLDYLHPGKEVVCVLSKHDQTEGKAKEVLEGLPKDATIRILWYETREYPLKNDKTTFYVCDKGTCHLPVNEITKI